MTISFWKECLAAALAIGCIGGCGPRSGHVEDEAKRAGVKPEAFKAADEDFFRAMDGGIALSPEQVKGRNMWIVWSGGDDRFWDAIGPYAFGALDLLKTISSYPGAPYGRHNRWNYLGLVNEPCFKAPQKDKPGRFGLYLDEPRNDRECPRKPGAPLDPFADPVAYPGVKIGARGTKLPDGELPVGSSYGEPTGIVGLRLFTNPDFDEAAYKKWDPKRYYEDPSYYLQKDLVRPYRVGMSCGFCHVGPNPSSPPADPENPKWANLSSVSGAQYLWIDRVIVWDQKSYEGDPGKGVPANYLLQMLHTSRPGTLDTSLVSTDNVNNPRTMNAVYQVYPRLLQGKLRGQERLAGGELKNRQFGEFPMFQKTELPGLFHAPDTALTPHVLKDGSDSVGALGALNRVYLNIGLFSEEWLLHFNPFVGGKRISPIEIAVAQKNSNYWLATELQTPYMAAFLVEASAPGGKGKSPHGLASAPGGSRYLTKDAARLKRGKIVFAENCARCHSSKLPEPVVGLGEASCIGPGYLDCWKKYWQWTKQEDFKAKMRAIAMTDDFLKDNLLSTDVRVPVTLLQTNACSPLATNAIRGNIWDNFSSQSYKDLPSVGALEMADPFTGKIEPRSLPAGGRGYTRPASLVALWSTAPLLLNNSLGPFDPNPSVDHRMASFQASIEQLLWPEQRPRDPVFAKAVPGSGTIDRLKRRSTIQLPVGFQPWYVRMLRHVVPSVFDEAGNVSFGPLPAGMPVGLLANLKQIPDSDESTWRITHYYRLARLGVRLWWNLTRLPANAGDQQALKVIGDLKDDFLAVSKCQDFVVDRGHYFGTGWLERNAALQPVTPDGKTEAALSDQDKRDLIEFLKTF